MIRHAHVYITLFVCLMLSCRKDDGKIEGTVTLLYYGDPLKNANVYVSRSHHHNAEQKIASTTTDENGHFELTYDFRSWPGYVTYINVARSGQSEGYHSPIQRKKSKSDIAVAFVSRIKLTVKNNLFQDILMSINDLPGSLIEASQQKLFSIPIAGFGQSYYEWSYFIPDKNFQSDTTIKKITLTAKTDTVYRTIEIN